MEKALVLEPLGIGLVVELRLGQGRREVADVADPLYLVPGDAQDLAIEVQDLQFGGILTEEGTRIAGAPVPGELAYDHRFADGCHCFGLSHEWTEHRDQYATIDDQQMNQMGCNNC